MKIIFIKYKVLLTIIIILTLIIISSFTIFYVINNRSINTFNNKDVFYKGNVDKKIIAFTCNVDWGNENIPYMMEILRENNIKITFFVTGRWAEKYTDLLKSIYAEGHEIGNHGFFHRDYSLLSYDLNMNEISKADKIINKALGIKPKYFAPPSGAYNQYTIQAANDLSYKVILWSIDTIDWRPDSTKDIITNRVINKSHKSAIVLMHPKSETVKALPIIIKNLQLQGYKIGKVSDVIK